MTLTENMTSSLYGAYRLARADKTGLAYFDASIDGFWRSFFAAVMIGPLFALFLIIRYNLGAIEASPFRYMMVEGISYVIAWVAFPLLMFYIAQAIQREKEYIGYIVAYNWASVWQNLFYIPLAVMAELGFLPGGRGVLIGIIMLGVLMLYTWFITRTALNITTFVATIIVAIDLSLSIFINSIAEGLLRMS